MGVGGIAGKYIRDRVELRLLLQTVAAFHSLVGVAASATAIGDYANAPMATELDKAYSRPSSAASPAPDRWSCSVSSTVVSGALR